jgi:hypothetical protein
MRKKTTRNRSKRYSRKPKRIDKFKSALEHKSSLLLGEEWEYEPYDIEYVMVRKYKPDFVKGNILIEVKGFFRSGDQAKYLAIKNHLEATNDPRELVFAFSNPQKKVRKGAKLTMEDWCHRHGFRVLSVNDLKEIKND